MGNNLLGVPICIGKEAYATPTSVDLVSDSSGNTQIEQSYTIVSTPLQMSECVDRTSVSAGTSICSNTSTYLPSTIAWPSISSHTIKLPSTDWTKYVNTFISNTAHIEKTSLHSHLEAFISDHPDRAYVTDRGHGPLPFSALEEAYKDIKFILVKLQGTEGGWRSNESVNYLYNGLYCFFTREDDSSFEWKTYENFRSITLKQGRGGVAAVGKMSCLMTADMIFDPYADLIRREFFRQFPRGEFDSRTKKLNQRIFFISTSNYASTIFKFKFNEQPEVTTLGVTSYSAAGATITHTQNYSGDFINPIIAFAYFTAEGIELFTGIDVVAGSFTRDWVLKFLRTFYPVTEDCEEIEQKHNVGANLNGSFPYKSDNEILYEGRIFQYIHSMPPQLLPDTYFKSSALLLMLLTNYLYKNKEFEYAIDDKSEDMLVRNISDAEDIAFFKWIFKECPLMENGRIFSTIAYESQHHIIFREAEDGTFISFNMPVNLNMSQYEEHDEFLKKEGLKIIKPTVSIKLPERMAISSI